MAITTALDPKAVQNGGSEVLITDARIVNLWTLGLANDAMGTYTTHIIFAGDPETAHHLLDSKLSNYVNGCCLSLGCDARVEYIANGRLVKTVEYGWTESNYTMIFKVYCNGNAKACLELMKANMVPYGVSVIVVQPCIVNEYGYTVHLIHE